MENENKEKIFTFFKVFILCCVWFFIALLFTFFFAIAKVDAQAIDYIPDAWAIGNYSCPNNNNYCVPGIQGSNNVWVRYFNSNHIFQSGHTYNIIFIGKVNWSGTPPSNPKATSYSMQVWNGSSYITATPDRYESVTNMHKQGDDYYFDWSFQLDVTFDVDFVVFNVTANILIPNLQVTFTIEDTANQTDTQVITDTIYFNSQNIINNNNQNTQEITNSLGEINDLLSDDSIDSNTGTSFFSNFDSGSTGTLTDIISLPLDFVNSLSNTCEPIVFPTFNFHNFSFTLTIPCLSSLVYSHFNNSLINLLRLLINGIILYRMLVWFVEFVKNLKDPQNDDLEVMDL